MQIYLNENLSAYHTFGIEQSCQVLVTVDTVAELIDVYRDPQWQSLPKMVLGKGSNVLFTEFYEGVVILNQLRGIDVREDENHYFLHVQGGEGWPELVEWCVSQQIPGLENLAMIPGCAGSAPIQNIGAYGIEFQDVCDYVDYLCLETFQVIRLNRAECLFGYRDSIFKHQLYQRAVVVGVGLKLTKAWQPRLKYGPLQQLASSCSPAEVFDCICDIRTRKLPDPTRIGNAGSFFKNPVLTEAQFQTLAANYPDVVSYPASSGVKVAAGWLIDQCGLKGFQIGGAAIHEQQALVVINRQHATALDVIQLAAHVYRSVYEKYGVALEHEVRFIGRGSEVYLDMWLKEQQS
ncbi:UDP-N-acetylenolpyruvoylglucosamine reductase [Vibrio ruber DSM 16370]|uniref:UDP-N-acetylenolpyruvoylglucosamine reductase n=1 Tax=Vibrio ruber (strain DSM 16370 / JCM 11486 / BCRC 17186 / CECT 7878 / LMG 23124 / VR1) TaxID=1123498 RepID=A0A1R4LPD6_VIBR1|nr:UDP-N-acetylmuramate dehydrogenase [Vibrio ruber]SJN58462.1 UDP-N-acetylenolpyruvoylglucosamine reductase [Vibrio ruber DSM 16370]